MKKAIFTLLLLCATCAAFSVKAEETSENITTMKEMVALVSKELTSSNFGVNDTEETEKKKGWTEETYNTEFRIFADGQIVHVAYWADCVVGTVYGNSPWIGLQVVSSYGGQVIEESYAYSLKGKYIENYYPWRVVKTYPQKQIVKRK